MSESETKYCKYCGTKISIDSVFCEKCGKSLIENTKEDYKQHEASNIDTTKKPFVWSDDVDETIKNNSTNEVPTDKTVVCKTCGHTVRKGMTCSNCGAGLYALITPKKQKCKHCGGDVASTASKCPHCGKKPIFMQIMTGIVIGILAVLLIISSLFGYFLLDYIGDEISDWASQHRRTSNTRTVETNTTDTNTTNNDNSKANNSDSQSNKHTLIHSDWIVDVSFMKMYDLESTIKGTIYLQLKVYNKYKEPIRLMLTDVSVNDMSVLAIGGATLKTAPGNSIADVFGLLTGKSEIYKAEEVKNIKFKLKVMDEHLSEIHTTDEISLDF